MKLKYSALTVHALALVCFLFARSVSANVWTNSASGTWTTGANWAEGTAPNATDALGDFSQVDLLSGITVHLDASQTVGDLIFSDVDTNTAAAWTLDNNGNSANVLTLDASSGSPGISVTNAATISAKVAGIVGLGKFGPGVLTLSSAAYTGQTTVSNGLLVLNGSSLLSSNDDLWLGYASAPTGSRADITFSAATQKVNNFVTLGSAGSLDINGILTTNNTTLNLITIPTGGTLRVLKNTLFGYLNANGIYTNNVTFAGGGSFVQKLDENADPSTPINFQVGADNLSSGQTGPRSIVDMSGLSSMELNLGINNSTIAGSGFYPTGAPSLVNAPAGSLIIGDVMKSGAGGELCSLLLATNTTITANAVIVGFARAAGFVQTLVLGSGANVFNVTTNSLAAPPGLSGREGGKMYFAGPSGTLKIRAQDGTSRATFFVAATRSSNPGRNLASGLSMSSEQYADLSGHNCDLLLSTLIIGDERHGNFTLPPQYWTNYFNFSQGTLDTTDLELGITRGGGADGTNYYRNTCNLLGGTVIVGTNGITMAQITANVPNPSQAGRQFLYTNDTRLNIGGGTVTVNGNINAALQSTTNIFYLYSAINITNGALTVNGNIYCGTPGSLVGLTLPLAPRIATLTLDGGMLDLTGHAIGGNPSGITVTNNYIDQVNLLSGTLQNVSQINDGVTKLVKSGPGVLTLNGVNSYSGGTMISNGTVLVLHDDALGAADVEVASGASLTVQGGVNNRYISPAGRLLLDAGAIPVNLNFSGTPNHISGLSFDGGATLQAGGTWGSSASGATHQDDAHFSGTGTLLVTASTSVALTSSANPAVFGQAIVFTATVTGGAGTPTGSVNFKSGATILGSGTLDGSGVAKYTNSTLPLGNASITAVYNGDNTYSPATSSVIAQSVTTPPPSPLLISVSGGNFALQVNNSISGTNYVLVSSPNLQSPITWTPVQTNAGTGGTITFTIPVNTATPSQFFRYLLQ